ncbi:hypothetical protein SAMN04515665_11067 [Blastococcus sp. DSM 46786]|uniref:DUF6049 family protein n=1 Tax=Blastococcus sp. DSM 46786 TaxID=1798227 RepID=UPI0008C45D9D|nr:DUF6049 family protein [Blastococcus sp. DSM 46786]SEL24602.1 hypothetical protein SAMN04515665_11067 [Blastococcus sp. DSM 46786]
MTRPAATRAGGRPAAATARQGTVRRAVALVPLLSGALVLGGPLLAPATVLAPAAAAPAPTAPDGTTTSADRPVRIDVARFEPRTVTPGALITVTGTLTNTGPDLITGLTARLQRGDVLTARPDLADAVSDPDPATTVQPPFAALPGALAPGGSVEFSYTIDSAELRLEQDGVYPVLFNVNGTVDGDQERRVGELATFLVQQPVVPSSRTTVAWLWPLSEPSHRDASGDFVDDGLAEAVSEGGRLDRALAVVERLPGGQPGAEPGAPPAAPLPVTLAIDPALVEELARMAAGPYAVDGVAGAGTGTEAARAYLDRLRAVVATRPVVALPYGDVDADGLQAAGMPAVLTRSLPGTPDGTAQDPPGPPPVTEAPAVDGATPPPEPAAATGAGAEIIADVLDVTPITDLAWSPDGSYDAATLGTLRAGGIDQVVLGSGALTDGDSAVGLDGSDAVARSSVPVGDGALDVLVADPTLSAVVGAAEVVQGGPRIAEQRYLAELAALTLQAPPGSEQTVLVAPPRDLEAELEGAGAMIADTAGLPWLQPGSVTDLGAAPPADAGTLAAPGEETALDPAGLAVLGEAVAAREELADAIPADADLALQPYDAGIARASSVLRRDDPEEFVAAALDARATMDRLQERVTVVAPADGTYSLASSDAPLVLTVDNPLPFPVDVRLRVDPPANGGLAVGDIGVQTLAPEQRTTLQVPTELRRSGGFTVTAQVTTPAGSPLGDRVEMQVKSTAYGPISLSITIGAASLLALLFLRRLVHFLIRRRRSTAAGDAGAGPSSPALSPAPTRSPV